MGMKAASGKAETTEPVKSTSRLGRDKMQDVDRNGVPSGAP